MDTEDENPDHILEFLLSDLSERKERRDLMYLVYEKLTEIVGEKGIVGCDFLPFGRAPKKVIIQCKNEQVKDTLLVQGINLLGSHVNLREPMDSPLRVSILGAPTYVKNVLIRNWLSKYGKIVDFQNEHFNYKGKRTGWRVNTRVALMKNISEENKIPPWGMVKYRNKDVEFWVKFDGQNDMKCFSCNEFVPKTGHECTGQGSRKKSCYNCGGTDHLKYTCKYKEKVCHKCKQPGHTMRNCTALSFTEENYPPIISSTPKGKEKGSEVSNPSTSAASNKNSDVFQVQAEVHQVTTNIEVQPGEQGDDGEWELDRAAKRRRMNKQRNGSAVSQPADIEASVRSRKASIASNCSEAWEIIDVLGEEEVQEAKKGPTKDPEINHHLMNKFFQQKLEVRPDEEDQEIVEETEEAAMMETDKEEGETSEDKGEAAVKSEDKEEEAETSKGKNLEEASQDVSAPSILDELPGHTFELDVTSFGSSNMRDVVMTGDQDLKINFNNLVSKGMHIRKAHERIDDLEDEDKKTMSMVVVNVGATDFKHGEETSLMELGLEYADLVAEIQYYCPEAAIIVSSVFPRSGKGIDAKVCEETNTRILSFNNELRKHCDTLKDVHFVDNYMFLLDSECKIKKELYDDDIHLNPKGKKELSASLFEMIKTVYFASRLRTELLDASL